MYDERPFRAPRDLVLPVRIDPTGRTGPTRGQTRGPAWRAAGRGFHVPASVDPELPEQRVAEAAVRLGGGAGAVTGWGALLLMGVAFLDGRVGAERLPVRLVTGPGQGRRAQPGTHVLQEPLGRVLLVRGVPVLEPVRALWDEMRHASCLEQAVVAADMAMAARVVSREEIDAFARAPVPSRAGGWRGAAQARRALTLADPGAASPPETRLRLTWLLDSRLPPPLVNAPVFAATTGRLLGYPDLLDARTGLAVEYDGVDHRRLRRQTDDNHRHDLMVEHGLTPVHVTAFDLRDRARLVTRLLAGQERARRPGVVRRWTLQPPPGWRPPRR